MKSKDIPDLNKYLSKSVVVNTKNKKFVGELRGHDAFINLVLNKVDKYSFVIIRGDSVIDVHLSEN